MDVGEVCSICFDAFEDPVWLPCGHKLCMKCAQSMSPMIIGKETKFNGNNFLSIDITEYGITCPYRCSKARTEIRRPSYDYMAMYSPDICLRNFIVCFLIDGSDKYMEMTIRAINSLQMSTPVVFVGILVPPHYDTSDLYSRFIDPTRVIFKEFKTHFTRWNPTQHKLDIAQFATEFSIIFWLDSDTYVYKDLTPLLMDFRVSNAKFAFVADHVCKNPEFLGNWKNKKSPFIPQACIMGFRREYIHSFFSLWEEVWRSWIEPAPFHNFPDPVPSFAGSAFCIEQYALGMAIEKFGLSREDIFELRRVCIPLGGLLTQQPLPPKEHLNNNLQSTQNPIDPQLATLGSSPPRSTSNFLQIPKPKNQPPTNSKKGFGISVSPDETGFDAYFGKSFDSSNNYFSFGQNFDSNQTFKPNFGSSNNQNNNNNNNWNQNTSTPRTLDSQRSLPSTPTLVAEMERTFLEHMSSYGTSFMLHSDYMSSFSSSSSSASSVGSAFWIDDIEGYVLHFYSLNYEVTFAWFTNHKNMIMNRTEEYWAPRNIPPLLL